MKRFLFAFSLVIGFISADSRAIEVCRAQVVKDRVTIVRDIEETGTKMVTVTRMLEIDGRQIPETVVEERTYTEIVPVDFEESLAAYRISGTDGEVVDDASVRETLASGQWVIYLTEDFPAPKRLVFRLGTLFFEEKIRLIEMGLARLDPHEARLLELRYGLNGEEAHTDEELERAVNIASMDLQAALDAVEQKLGFVLPPTPAAAW